jgi:hypothetical protein
MESAYWFFKMARECGGSFACLWTTAVSTSPFELFVAFIFKDLA